MMLLRFSWLLAAAPLTVAIDASNSWNTTSSTELNLSTFQPKAVITVEKSPARRVFSSLSFPEGSPWCDGKPTYWLVGHENFGETPWCLVGGDGEDSFVDYDYADSTWEQSSPAVLANNIDRHSCATMDVNLDGYPDVLCGVGAKKGTGQGYNEVYVTQTEVNDSQTIVANSLVKMMEGHGLDKYTTMRNRLMVSLKGADGSSLVFLATRGSKREDGEPNQHRMFRLTHPNDDADIPFHFEEVTPSPWRRYTKATCLHVVDVNQDGLDDILLCNQKARAWIYLQKSDGSWDGIIMNGGKWPYDWRNARIADVTGDDVPDLITVGDNFIRIFQGTGVAPFFEFNREGLYYWRALPYAASDVEVLDVNGDGFSDIYVTQNDETTPDTYCAGKFDMRTWWQKGNQPPASFVPPLDDAPDLLLVGSTAAPKKFHEVFMNHSEPGCGFYLEHFGNNRTLILGQGMNDRPGYNLLLQW